LLICDRCKNPATNSDDVSLKITKRSLTLGTAISAGSMGSNPIVRPDMDQVPDLCDDCYQTLKTAIKSKYDKVLGGETT
jgi:hypothetical protein